MKLFSFLSVFTLLFSSILCAQDAPPAFDRSKPNNGAEPNPDEPLDGGGFDGSQGFDPFDLAINAPKMVRIQTEFIGMSHKDATRLLMEDKAKTFDASELRMKVQKMVEAKEAEILDTQAITARSGEKATAESIAEFIYPTEYDPIPLAQDKEEKEKGTTTPSAAAPLPTAFETRNTGSTLEVEPTIGEADQYINLRYVPELVTHTGNTTWREVKDAGGNVNKVEMPDFYTMRLNSAITCINGQYCLTAVLSPKDENGKIDPERKVMVFVKCTVLPVVP